jgi:acyl carrier protein
MLALLQKALRIPVTIRPDTPLISSGLIDSFQLAALLFTLNQHYQVNIEMADVGVDNFDTAQQMLALVQMAS